MLPRACAAGNDKAARDAQGRPLANHWQGMFPVKDLGEDGHRGSAPVGCYPPNGHRGPGCPSQGDAGGATRPSFVIFRDGVAPGGSSMGGPSA